jgi:carbon-monoxide dehydrogenase medium subunit
MKPPPFDYLKPMSLEEALAVKSQYGEDAKVLAGGQSLIPTMNYRLVQPSVLIDLNELSELDHIQSDQEGHLCIGAMTRQRRLEFDGMVEEVSPLLHEAMPLIAHPQIRNRGTIGGSMVHADPAAELPVLALVSRARFRLQNSEGERWVPAEHFFLGMFMTDLQADEILVEVVLPPMPSHTGWSFLEVSRRKGDYAMMGVAVWVTLEDAGLCKDARLVFINAGDGPIEAVQAARLIEGEKYSDAIITAAAEVASGDEIDPFGSVHASVDFQRHLAKVLTQRALKQAFERAEAALI